MYLSMCLIDKDEFKRGEFYETYIGKGGHHLKSEKTKKESIIDSDVYHEYFEWVDNYIKLSLYSKREPLLSTLKNFFQKEKLRTIDDEFYSFSQLNETVVRKIQSQVLIYLYLIKDKELIAHFTDTIRYTLNSLLELYQVRDVIDFDKEIEKASKIFQEIYTYIAPIQNSGDKAERQARIERIQPILEKHNTIQLIQLENLKKLNLLS